ncbi:MAG: ABC transporter ATP-binding protein [Thermoprotei archaeon]|jgi:branched-chain amino acid transport system ATP-binding protein
MEGKKKEILRVENLVKKFGGFTALNKVNLSIASDGITSIIGPNGAGKTTLINVITGKLKPESGRVYFMGRDITGLQPNKIVRLGISRTFQVINLLGSMTVYQNLLVASLSRGGNNVDVSHVLSKFHLEDYKDTEIYKLPHGIQRIVEMAVATTTKPKLLLLDEPIAGLNTDEKNLVISLIRDLERNIPIVLVEHDMDVVFSISKRIIVMNKGEVLASGTPDEIAENKYVREIYLGV